MAASYRFHPEALLEVSEATRYYLSEASPAVADRFADAVDSAAAALAAAPTRWRTVEKPGIRRYVIRGFPFVTYYRWDASENGVTIYAVAHCSRAPGYWRHRLN